MNPSEGSHEQSDGCCSISDVRVGRRFDLRASAWAARDEFPEMVATSAAMLDRFRDVPPTGLSVLEIGCGTGALSLALLEMGARRITGVDLSPVSLEVAQRRVRVAGFEGQATFALADATSANLEPHDWVVMDRVMCCDAHVDVLLDRAIAAAGSRIALSVPESHGWRGLVNRPVWTAGSTWDRLSGGCPGYVHSVRRIQRRLREAGFHEVAGRRHARLWYVGVFERTSVD